MIVNCGDRGVHSACTLTTSGSTETDIGIPDLVKNTAVSVIILTWGGDASGRLAKRNAGLEDWTLHVINEDGKVTWLAVSDLARVAVVWGRILCWSIRVLTVTTCRNVGSVDSTTGLVVGKVVHTIVLGSINELWPILDLHGVVLAVSQVRDGWSGSKVLVQSVIRLSLTVGGEDSNVVVVVSNKFGGVDPPAADTLLGIMKLEVVPSVELNSKHLIDTSVAVHEATGTGDTTATIAGTSVNTEGAYLT